MDVADPRNVVICWNSNPTDLNGKGFAYNFNLVKDRLGDTIHVHEMDTVAYPWQELMNELVKMDYSEWILWECASNPDNKVEALIKQRKLWEGILAKAQK